MKNDETQGKKQGNILNNRGKTMKNDAQERNKQEKIMKKSEKNSET